MSIHIQFPSSFRSIDTSAVDAGGRAPATSSQAPSEGTHLLPDPIHALLNSGDPGAEMAALVLQSAKEDKKIGRSIRDAEERAQQAAEAAQLAKMQEKADSAYMAGLASGFGTVASGLVSAVGASKVGEASKLDADRANASPNIKTPASATSVEMVWGAYGKLTEGTGKLVATHFQGEADDADVEATHQEQLAGRHKRAVDDARDQVRDAKDLVDRTLSFYKEYTTAKADAQRAAFIKA